jgi:hypothetical protein
MKDIFDRGKYKLINNITAIIIIKILINAKKIK